MELKTRLKSKKCYCFSGLSYEDCCGIYHQNLSFPATPELLMRSRYTAYALNLVDYLIQTTYPSHRHLYKKEEIAHWAMSNTWLKLEICETEKDVVEFKAYYQNGLKKYVHHERSVFKQQNGIWYYFSGTYF